MCHFKSLKQSGFSWRLRAEYAVKFTGMRCQYWAGGYMVDKCRNLRDDVECVSIKHHGSLDSLYQCLQRTLGGIIRADARAHTYGMVTVSRSHVGNQDIIPVRREQCLRHGGLYHVKAAARRMHCEFAHTGPQGSPCSHLCSPHHAIATGYQQCMSEIGFRTEVGPWT